MATSTKKSTAAKGAKKAGKPPVASKAAKIHVKTATKKSAAKASKPAPAKPAKAAKAPPPPRRSAAPAKAAPKSAPAKAAPAKAAPAKAAPAKAAKPAAPARPSGPAAPKVAPAGRSAKPSAAASTAAAAEGAAAAAAGSTGAAGSVGAAGAAGGAAKPGAKGSPPPRLTVRTPVGADELKQKIGALATATAQIRNLKRTLSRSFFEIGEILKDIDDRKLYEVKGYGSFEAFVEREIDLGKQLGLRLARAVQVFHREAAIQAGLDRVSAAIAVLDGEVDPSAAPPAASPTSSGGARSPIPFHKQ